jgi:hypothetical protein
MAMMALGQRGGFGVGVPVAEVMRIDRGDRDVIEDIGRGMKIV